MVSMMCGFCGESIEPHTRTIQIRVGSMTMEDDFEVFYKDSNRPASGEDVDVESETPTEPAPDSDRRTQRRADV